jgi:hypothetical protein
MKYYIIHYTKNTERRALLEVQLEKLQDCDIEWIEKYDKEDPYVSHMKEKTKSSLNLKEMSICLKNFEAFKRMVDGNVNEAIILDDDVIFYPEFITAKPFHPCGFLRLGLGVGILPKNQLMAPPRGHKIWISSNPAGAEAQWVSLDFAKLAINNINFDAPIDLYHAALLYNLKGEKLRCMNLCYQTSLLESDITDGTEWKGEYEEYCKNFNSFKSWTLK